MIRVNHFVLVSGLILTAIALACSGRAVGEQPAASPECRPWRLVPSPDFGGGTLFGVSGESPTDVWAVGHTGAEPIVQHWDGMEWSGVVQDQFFGYLSDVVAIGPTDAWAVGGINASPQKTLVEHWDGVSWERVPSPSPGDDPELDAVAAVLPDDVWAAGNYPARNGTIQPLFLHWDGTTWKRVPQGPGTKRSGGKIYDLMALSPTDIWAVGYKGTPVFPEFEPLAEHWDGTSWQVVDVPNPTPGANVLRAVSGVAPDDVWAVGSITDGGFIEHWDETAWSLVRNTDGGLWGIGAVSTNDVWAVGGAYQAPALIVHWDGSDWTKVRGARAGLQSSLRAVEVISSEDVWAVGNYSPNDFSELDPVTLHYAGPCGD